MPDTFFKILGGTDPVNQTLGVMTQGLGYPLRDVEPAVSGGAVTVDIRSVLEASSFVDQIPTSLGVALQLTLGGAQATPEFSVDVLGNITCLIADQYNVRVRLVTGRRGGGAATAQIYARGLINGTPVGYSSHSIIDNADIEIPLTYSDVRNFEVGDVLTFQIIRDTDGNNSGGLYAGVPDVVGWASSPSALITIDRIVAVTP